MSDDDVVRCQILPGAREAVAEKGTLTVRKTGRWPFAHYEVAARTEYLALTKETTKKDWRGDARMILDGMSNVQFAVRFEGMGDDKGLL